METIVYKLTRTDGLAYIGTAVNFRQRMWQHEHSKRFASGITLVEVLGKFKTYEEALDFEVLSITEHDTYRNGLNETPSGRGNHGSPSFTTRGMKFSEASRKKMSLKSRERRAGQILNEWKRNLSEEDRLVFGKRISRGKKGKPSHTTFSEETIKELMTLFMKTKSQPKAKAKNGRYVSSLRSFCKAYAERFNMTVPGMMNILEGKVIAWKPLYERIIAIRS